MEKPIDPTTHAALDYGLSAIQVLGPQVVGLNRRATAISSMFGAMYGASTAMTDTPLGVKRIIPFSMHGMLELPSVAAMLVVPALAGALKDTKSRTFFLACAGMAVANYLLTDFHSMEEAGEPHAIEDVSSAVSEAFEGAGVA